MGVGVSSLRLRKALILRAYNLRDEDQTLAEQFAHLGERAEDGVYYIPLDDVKDYLGFGESSQVEGTYRRLLGGSLLGTRVLFTEFIEFLETGKTAEESGSGNSDPASLLSSSSGGAASPTRSTSKIRILKGFPGAHNGKGDLPIPGRNAVKSFPPGSPSDADGDNVVQSSGLLQHEKALKLAQTLASADYTDLEGDHATENHSRNENGSYKSSDDNESSGGGANKQSEGTPEPKGSWQESEAQDDISEYDGPEPIIEENDDDADADNTGGTNTRLSETREVMVHANSRGHMVSNNVWRKREVVKQEREVFYTTVDADGQLQELVEKETSETEVLHMESRDTGEFAHRETTLYQQKETFNNEIVSEQDGREEYVHLKSNADEYENVESSMPAGRRGAGAGRESGADGDGSSSPRVGGAGAGAGASTDFAAAADAQGGVGSIDLSGVNPDELDDETKAYFLYVLKEQREEAAYRLQAMKQQEDLCDQYGAFDGLTDSDLDDETRAYKAYLEESIANIGRYLGEEIGVGVKNAMVMLEREQEELGDREKEGGRDEAAVPEGQEDGGKGEDKPTIDTTMDDEDDGEGEDGGDQRGKQAPYEEPDSPLPESWFQDAKAAPVPLEPGPNSADDGETAGGDQAVATESVAEGGGGEEEEEDDTRSTPASLHDID